MSSVFVTSCEALTVLVIRLCLIVVLAWKGQTLHQPQLDPRCLRATPWKTLARAGLTPPFP